MVACALLMAVTSASPYGREAISNNGSVADGPAGTCQAVQPTVLQDCKTGLCPAYQATLGPLQQS